MLLLTTHSTRCRVARSEAHSLVMRRVRHVPTGQCSHGRDLQAEDQAAAVAVEAFCSQCSLPRWLSAVEGHTPIDKPAANAKGEWAVRCTATTVWS